MASVKRWLSQIYLFPRFKWIGFDHFLWEGGSDVMLWEDGAMMEGEDRG